MTALPGPELPAPAPGRWRPLRIGLVDLFHYDVEEFWFRDGRLLLRGNNGTGKSKVLALTLPFLLDGDLSARRVEPDGDPGKRMEWNLLLGGAHPHPERLGYTWIEFGRLDAGSGETHFRTLLCGLKAVAGRGVARHWFAVTSQRIGAGLDLLDATGTALSRDRLAEAVGGHGMVYDTAKAYRRAVDEALFGLGERRYGALVDLLIQLRQPQLSKRPSEAALSRALTEALPPMDQAVVADAAEAFRSLDEEKEELRAAREAEQASSAFLDHYRRYARLASRRRARLPRREHARYENLQRELARAQADRDQASAEREEAAARGTALDERAARLAAQDATLRSRPEMRDARALDRAAEDASRTAADLKRAEADRRTAAEAHTRVLGRLATADNRLTAAREALDGIRDRVAESAAAARLDLPRTEGAPDAVLRREADEATASRRRAVEHVTELVTRAEQAEERHRAARLRVDEADEEVVHGEERLAGAQENVALAGRALVKAVRERLSRCVELRVPGLPAVLDAVQDWASSVDGPLPARTAASEAHRAAASRLADRAAGLAHREAATAERLRQAMEEMTALETGGERGPAAPQTRTPGVRDQGPGAPLWRLVDFRPHVTETDRAGLEAALEASGLLDAWVRPDGSVVAADGHDVMLDPVGLLGEAGLDRALCPAVDPVDAGATAVGEETVARLLASIGLAAGDADGAGASWEAGGHTWVCADGRFRVGALTGSWAKDSAQYVGEGAREQARRVRVGELRAEIDDLTAERERLVEESHAVAGRRSVLDAELAALPGDDDLRHAHARVTAAAEAVRRAHARRDERAAELAPAAERADRAATELADTAVALNLPADHTALGAVRQALADHTALLAALWPALRERAEAERAVTGEREETSRAELLVSELAERATDAARVAAAADEHLTTLRSTVGAAVAGLQRQLEETAEAARACEHEQRQARAEHGDADRRASRAEGRIERLTEDVTEATAAREEAVAALQRFTATGLLAVALPDIDVPDDGGGTWAATPAVALARAVESRLSSIDDTDAAWERVQKRLSEEFGRLQDALSRHGHTATARPSEDGMRVDIVYQGRERAVPELAEALAVEVAELTRILSAREREILQTHLITEVAGTLQELIGAAERQVAAMNRELEERPTSTGMKLRLVWRASRRAPQGLAQARERLRQSADAWSPEDRVAVGAFLQEQIAHRQADDDAGSWLEDLTAALDYRSWHEFGVERHQHGKWVPATGPASGGERVLAASVPLFAAASSHYASAGGAHAPRLVTLDEAFAGVDDDSRAKCLGLLRAFDLDVVMTSEREWACYPQVPGIAIAQLARVDDIDAVLVTRWEWDGSERRRGTEPGARPEALGAAARAGDSGEGPDGPVSPFGEPGRTVVGGAGGQGSLWT
ncbi:MULTISPECIES: TIGR02680 family protein [Streptomyces]|uniref:TIGR02680 family protein n=1 Tax=Streptomyces caniscabiei TaxID=2746961 RepID=A0ABU4MPN7_9ACTN|nr:MULTISPECIES: TIGR02680 family protein [Streptomyces]MDX2941644.1 TIGR02680 family protein [Streptomyces caniscabiei]MDX2952083.1 TIGR02680 family protein [Streptomyces caniscabiei]MDX2990345.1 TIGR02680 family protein [Streptomyces caniscabiei]MDX3012005.1 TIGR02680 family protein [Streptomyces caniscabiei]MDX3038562.1 TIGR02680 family protein [Streptomyces caniscabiei]